MRRDKLEFTVNEMDNRFIEEALTFKKASVKPIYKAVRIAAAAVAVLVMGAVGTIAVVREFVLRQVNVDTNSISVGEEYESESESETEIASDEVIDLCNPDETIEGDETVDWISKSVTDTEFGGGERYEFDDVNKALKAYEAPMYIGEIPGGELVSAAVTEIWGEEKIFSSKSLSIHYRYEDGDIIIYDTLGEAMGFSIETIGETTDPRKYTNVNGVEFTIVSDTGNDAFGNDAFDYVVISYENHYGWIEFLYLDDDQIHEVLDLVNPQ